LDEENLRRKVFFDTLETISLHNQKFDDGNVTFQMGINQLADMTFDEFMKMNEISRGVMLVVYSPLEHIVDDETEVPSSFDWRDYGLEMKIRDQKDCGACYAIAAVSALESQIFIKTGNLTELSVQEVLDCAGDYDAFGCEGGAEFRVFDYIRDNGGISSEADYPFVGRSSQNSSQNSSCQSSSFSKVSINITGYAAVPWRDEDILKQAIAKTGPIVASMNLSYESFMRYSSGVFYQENCEPQTNHVVLLIGYGEENGTAYWTIQNSYGESWGESGFMKISRNSDGNCGIDSELFYPVVSASEEYV
jgi:C1A family cysteine protease